MRYKKKENHCSFSPEGMLGCRYNYACFLHDRQYRNEVKKRQSRLVSDLVLWKNIIIECWKVRKTSILWSWYIGLWYFVMVRLFGGKNYV